MKQTTTYTFQNWLPNSNQFPSGVGWTMGLRKKGLDDLGDPSGGGGQSALPHLQRIGAEAAAPGPGPTLRWVPGREGERGGEEEVSLGFWF